jgi:hypothetical protein
LLVAPYLVVSGQNATLTASVQAVFPGAGRPTGTVTFRDGATVLGSAPLSGTTAIMKATLPVANLNVGTHAITASYSGDDNFAASTTLLPANLIVRAALTRTTLTSSALVVSASTPVTFTAVIGVLLPGTGLPTGTVTLREGNTVLGTAEIQIVGGRAQATLTLSTLSVGRHLLSAWYGGDGRYLASRSLVLVELVTAPVGGAG